MNTATLPASPELTDEELQPIIKQMMEAEMPDGDHFIDWLSMQYEKPKDVARILARIVLHHRSSPSSAWRDIKDAPKDGTWIMGWAARDSSPYRVSWGRNHRDELAWCTSFASFSDGYITHWQPLTLPESK